MSFIICIFLCSRWRLRYEEVNSSKWFKPTTVRAGLKSLPKYPSDYAVVISVIRSVKDISEWFVYSIITI
jgi:hypothetical protein